MAIILYDPADIYARWAQMIWRQFADMIEAGYLPPGFLAFCTRSPSSYHLLIIDDDGNARDADTDEIIFARQRPWYWRGDMKIEHRYDNVRILLERWHILIQELRFVERQLANALADAEINFPFRADAIEVVPLSNNDNGFQLTAYGITRGMKWEEIRKIGGGNG